MMTFSQRPIDKETMKLVYNFDVWLERVNNFSKYQSPPLCKQESADFEKKELDDWWENNYLNFERYSTFHYLYAGLNCFNNYSKNSAIVASQYLSDVKSVVDVGAGIGLSTMLLADLFPNAKIYYNNILDSMQAKFFELYKQERIEIASDQQLAENGPFDVLFASEYFEHFQRPIDQLSFLLNEVGFDRIVINNSFNVKAYGHFREFKTDTEVLSPVRMSRLFNKTVRRDYNDLKIKVWNGRPKIYVKK